MHERGNPNSLSGVDIESLFKDRDGALWIGCEQAVDRFDPKTETFTHFPVPMVKRISQDRAGLLWFSTDRGLYRLDQKSGKFRVYTHDPSDPKSLPDNHVVSAAEDKTGRFWVGEPYGMYEFDRATGHVKLSIPLHTASRDLSFYEDRSGDSGSSMVREMGWRSSIANGTSLLIIPFMPATHRARLIAA